MYVRMDDVDMDDESLKTLKIVEERERERILCIYSNQTNEQMNERTTDSTYENRLKKKLNKKVRKSLIIFK